MKTVIIVAAVAMVTVDPPTELIAGLARQVGARADPPIGFAIIESVHAMTQRPDCMLVRIVVSIAAVASIFEAIYRLFQQPIFSRAASIKAP